MAGGVDISSSSLSFLKQPVQQVHATHDGNEVEVSQLMASVPFDDPFLKNLKQRRNAFAPIPTTEQGVLFQNPAAGQPSMANSFETPIVVDGGANVLPWHSSVSAHGSSDPASHPPSNNTSHPPSQNFSGVNPDYIKHHLKLIKPEVLTHCGLKKSISHILLGKNYLQISITKLFHTIERFPCNLEVLICSIITLFIYLYLLNSYLFSIFFSLQQMFYIELEKTQPLLLRNKLPQNSKHKR
jgi:hypothetical protein